MRRAGAVLVALVVAGATAVVAPALPAAADSITPAGTAETYERADEVSARLAAAATGKEILITGDTTATSLTYAQPGGALRSEVSPVPVRVAQSDGSWADVDYDLHRVDDGWAPKVSPSTVVFSAGGDGPAVSLDSGARGLDLSWAKDLPEPVIDGNDAIYQLTATEALVLSATSDGFEQSLKLTAPPASVPKLRLGFDMTGLSMVANDTGGYDFVNSAKTAVFTMPAPKMYSSQVVDEEHTQIASVPVALGKDEDGSPYLDLSAGMSFLSDPATVYPVWIDPAVSSVSRYGDTYVTQADADSHVSDSDLRIGLSSNGNIRRSLIRFSTTSSVPSGSHVTSATLSLYNNTSSTCTARSMNAYPITESYTLTGATWSNQPAYSTSSSYSASASWSYGNEDLGCANATGTISLTNMVQAWVSGTLTDYGMLLKAGSETDATYAKYFCSMNVDATATTACTTSARYPTLSVVYNTYPGTPSGATFSPKVYGTTTDSYLGGAKAYSTSMTPAFTAKLTNADGAKVALQVKISHDVNYSSEGTGEVATITSAAVNPGAKASVTVPSGTLTPANHLMYQTRARVTNGAGGYDYSAWTPASLASTTATKFTLNTGLPAAPTVTCGGFPSGVWTVPTATTTSCTFATTSGDGSGYYWGLDDPSTPNLANDASNVGSAVAVSTIPTKVLGWHTLYVRSRDTALHLSASTTSYVFGVGAGGVLSPDAGAVTAKGVALSASANSGYTGITYQWAPGSSSTTWTDLPVADVTPAGSSTPIGAWPLTGTVSGGLTGFAGYNWNVASTLAAAGQPDGALRIRAKFTTATGTIGYSAERLFILAVTTFGQNASTDDLGPGEVSLTTGDYQVTTADATVGGLSVGRAATSLSPAAASTGPAGIFGAGWRAGFPGIGASDSTLIDNSASGSVTVQAADGTEGVYVKQSSGQYTGVGGADDGSVLVKSTAISNPADTTDTTVYTGWQLTDVRGTVTTWLKNTSGAWLVSWVDKAGKEGETTYARDANGRVVTVLGTAPTGVTCTTSSFSAAGCTALQITYATATTASGTAETSWGDYAGLVSGVTWSGYDPASSARVTKQVAAYQYDSTGHLRATWDPRLATPLKTRYSYDGAGRVATVAEPGQNAWTVAYDTAGRLASVSRTDPANGTATQAVAYGLGVSGVTGAPDVSGTTAAGWGQISDLAYSGAAIFPASHVPAAGSGGAYAPSATDWPYASITYADVNGTVVDEAAYGSGAWQIDSTRYDENGDEIWSLTAGNRAQALSPTADTDPYVAAQTSSAARADLLATISTYGDDGVNLAATLGPAHPAQLSSGDVASVRVKTAYTYDTGAPTSDAYRLVTKTVTAPVALDGTAVPAADTQTTTTGYDPIDGSSATGATSGWVLHEPTTVTTGGLTTSTRYDSSGRIVETRLPGGSATSANTTLTTYYTTAANSTYAACGGKAYWAGLLCRVDPGGAPSAGYAVPSKAYTYNLYGQTLTATETSGSVTRTTTTSYDAAGRTTGGTVAVTGLSGSTSVAATVVAYDPATGLTASVTQNTAVLASTYDALGRRLTYTDADGVTATYTYDVDGRVRTVNDGAGTTAVTYDSATEHRGLATALDAGIGTFTGTYDAAGQLTRQTYPNGTAAVYGYDNAGTRTGLTYTLPTYGSVEAGTLAFTDTPDAYGQTVHAQSPLSAQDYAYDTANRLSQVQDTVDGSCVTRAYGYSAQSDRTGLTSYAAAADGTCQTTTASGTVTDTYDTANRITDSGYTYDQLGRTLTVPAAGLAGGGSALSVAYYDTDLPAKMTQGTVSKTFTGDPAGRYRRATDSSSGIVLNHYADDDDSPSWITSSTDGGSTWTWSRNVLGIDGQLAAIATSGGSVLQLADLHGDVVATAPNHVPTSADTSGASTTAYFESTESGTPRDSGSTVRYGWLGGALRSSDSVAGIVLMGARLYSPGSGRFLSVDPITGGNANAYDYCSGNPVGCSDISGKKHIRVQHGKHWWSPVRYIFSKDITNRVAYLFNYYGNGSAALAAAYGALACLEATPIASIVCALVFTLSEGYIGGKFKAASAAHGCAGINNYGYMFTSHSKKYCKRT